MLTRAEFKKLSPTQRIHEIRGQRVERVLRVQRDSIDEEKRTVWCAASSEHPYERWWGIEILDHNRKSIRIDRLESGLAALIGHDSANHVGVVDDFEIAADRKLRTLVRFGRGQMAEEKFRDVLDQILVNVSVGYVIHDLVLEKSEEGLNTYRVTDWEPYEVSFVAVPADPTVGVGRSTLSTLSRKPSMHRTSTTHEEEPQTRSEERREARDADRVAALIAAGKQYKAHGGVELALELVDQPGADIETFKEKMLSRMRGGQRPFATAAPADAPAYYGEGARQILQKPKHFTGPDAERNAYVSGMWLRGLYGNQEAKVWCRDNGIEIRAMSPDVLSQGGVLVPEELSSSIIDLSDTYGAFRQNGDSWPMKSDSLTVPRSAGDPVAGFVAPNGSLPESDPSWSGVELSAKKIGVITRIPTELIEDSPINVADRTAFQIGRSFAKKEDQCGFLGDGTSTYGGMQGIFVKLVDGTHNAGKVVAASNHDTFAEIDGADLAAVIAALPEYALEGAKWYCSGTFFGAVFARLLLGLTGNGLGDVSGKVPKFYAGFPIITSPVLPAGASTDYSAQVMCAFGDLRLSSKFGARRDIRIQILTETYAANDQIGVMATERFHIVNHDLGDGTTAGPVVGLVGN